MSSFYVLVIEDEKFEIKFPGSHQVFQDYFDLPRSDFLAKWYETVTQTPYHPEDFPLDRITILMLECEEDEVGTRHFFQYDHRKELIRAFCA